MKRKTIEHLLPAYWASYLINGDSSGLERYDIEQADKFCDQRGIGGCAVDCGDPFFHYRNDAQHIGGDVCQFTFLVEARKAGAR